MRFIREVACVLGLWAATVSGQSIDPTRARATIGDPLDLEVLVRTTPELGAARLDRSCVQVQVFDGQRVMDDNALAIEIDPATESGLNRLRIRHASLVDEPLVQARVALTCGANYTREFTVLPQLGNRPANTARESSTKLRTRQSAERSNPVKLGRANGSGSGVSMSSSTTEVKATGAPMTVEGKTTGESRVGGGDVAALARSVLRMFQAAGLDLQQSSQGLLDLHRPDPAASLAAADSKYLMQEVERLRSESKQSATAIASLHARLERAESDRWQHATWAVLAVITGLVSLVIAVRVAEFAAPALVRRFSRRSDDDASSNHLPAKRGSSIEQYLSDIGARPLSTSSERVVTTPAPSTSAATAPAAASPDANNTLAFDEIDLLAIASPARSQLPSASTPHQPQARTHLDRWSHAEFGPASLDHRRVRLHRDDIDKAIQDGYLGFALVMLEQLLNSGEGKHPWVLLRLLDVYRHLRQQDNHERVCAEIEALYCVRAPGFDAEPTGADDDSIEQLDEWPTMRDVWPDNNASPFIAMCLLRGTRHIDHTAATFADLLFLHELAEIRDSPPGMESLAA